MIRSRNAPSASGVVRLHHRCIQFSTLFQGVHSAASNALAESKRCSRSLTQWRTPSASNSLTNSQSRRHYASRWLGRFPALRVRAPVHATKESGDHPPPDIFVSDELLRNLIDGVFATRNI